MPRRNDDVSFVRAFFYLMTCGVESDPFNDA